jgi:hypothetical protein
VIERPAVDDAANRTIGALLSSQADENTSDCETGMRRVMKRLGLWVLLPLLFIAVAAAVALSLSQEERPLLTSGSSWHPSGYFRPLNSLKKSEVFADGAAAIYWRVPPEFATTSTGERRMIGDGSGKLTSDPFIVPTCVRFMVIGDLTRPGNDLYFRRVADGKHYPVRARADGYFWRRLTLALPSDWVGKQVQLVAEAAPREPANWFGVTNPTALSYGRILLPQVRALAWLPVCALGLILFLLPGLPLAGRLARLGVLEPYLVLPAAIVLSCLGGYLTFWAYFFNRVAGLAVGWAVLIGGAVACIFELRASRSSRSPLLSIDVLIPLALMALVGAFFLCLLLSVDQGVTYELDIRIHLLEFVLAYDNELPFIFANSLYNGLDPRAIAPGWQSSDRPPLQAGLLLLQLPFAHWTPNPAEYALVVGSAMQCAWVPAVWSLWAAAGLPRRRAAVALLLVTLSGFALVNTLFTWPKLLSAALVVVAVTIALIGRPGRETVWPLTKAALFGLASALASLSHAGVAFTLLPLGLFLLLPRYYPGFTRLVAAGAVYAVVLCPWLLYQQLYDPPGNKLLRQHLAGDSTSWSEDKSLSRNLLDAYRRLSMGEILHNKIENVRMLFMASQTQYGWPECGIPAEWPLDTIGFRRCDFMCLFWSLGLLNAGWFAAAAGWWRRPPVLDPGLGFTVPALGLSAVVVWILLMFGPASTVIHQGSYATFLLLFASLAAWLATLPRILPYVLLVAQGTIFAIGWVFTCPALEFGVPDFVMIPLALFFFVALVRVAVGNTRLQELPKKKAR